MSTIKSVQGYEILDSRGNPTVLAQVELDTGAKAVAAVPSGASTGTYEAVEKRDGNKERYGGKGVLDAVEAINGELHFLLQGKSPYEQARIDQEMISLDGTTNKARLGANAILGVSLAVARAAAMSRHEELYTYLGGNGRAILPCPMFNIINGGAHADNSIDFQEFMIRPHAAPNFKEALRWGCEVYHSLKSLLKKNGLATGVGDEGGFAPNLSSDQATLDLIIQAISIAGFKPGHEISIALDCAATELYDIDTKRYVEKKKREKGIQGYTTRSSEEQIQYLEKLVHAYPIDSIEDGLAENDWAHWSVLQKRLGSRVQLVGDDIFVTNPRFLQRGIKEKSANAILIKPNQIGTLTETIDTVQAARRAGWQTIISHRSGETEDSFIADLAVALGCGQIKTGAPCRSERVSKYNRLLVIEAIQKPYCVYLDTNKERLL